MTENERLEVIEQRLIVLRQAMVDTAYDNSEQPGTYTADVSWLLCVIAERDAEIAFRLSRIARLLSIIAELDAEIARLRESFADELQAMVASDRAEIAKLRAALSSLVEYSHNGADALDGYFVRRLAGPALGLDLPQDDSRIGGAHTCYYPRIKEMKHDATDRVCLGCGKECRPW